MVPTGTLTALGESSEMCGLLQPASSAADAAMAAQTTLFIDDPSVSPREPRINGMTDSEVKEDAAQRRGA